MAVVHDKRIAHLDLKPENILIDSELTAFYANLSESEARHRDLFVDLAELYFDKDRVDSRLSEWLDDEARIVSELPISATLH